MMPFNLNLNRLFQQAERRHIMIEHMVNRKYDVRTDSKKYLCLPFGKGIMAGFFIVPIPDKKGSPKLIHQGICLDAYETSGEKRPN